MGLNMESVPASVLRDAKGRVVKGQTLNAGGRTTREARMLRDLRALGPRAIAKLGQLLDDPNGSVALGAAKEILDRNLGKVKQSVTVDVKSTHILHLEALQTLAERKRQQVLEAQAIDITNVATLEGIASHDGDADGKPHYATPQIDPPSQPPGSPAPQGAAANAPTAPHTRENS